VVAPVAQAIVEAPMASLENTALGEIQNWSDEDEAIVASLRENLKNPAAVPDNISSGFFAAHVVAAARTVAIDEGHIATTFGRMVDLLKKMHNSNAAWGPLFIAHSGNMARHHSYSMVPAAARRAGA